MQVNIFGVLVNGSVYVVQVWFNIRNVLASLHPKLDLHLCKVNKEDHEVIPSTQVKNCLPKVTTRRADLGSDRGRELSRGTKGERVEC
jgi:hypothetical protein